MEPPTTRSIRQSLDDSSADLAAGRVDPLDAYLERLRARIQQYKNKREQEAARPALHDR